MMPLLAALAGMSGCAAPATTDAGLCLGLGRDVAALRRALTDHPQTAAPVGEAATDVVIGFEAACR